MADIDLNATRPRLKVLLLSPAPSVPGGVVVFTELLREKLRHCDVTTFLVGSSPGRKEYLFSLAWRFFSTPWRLRNVVKNLLPDIVHMNPSFDRNSLLRDGLLLLILRMMKFTRVLVYFHGWDVELAARVERSWMYRHVLSWLLAGAHTILVLSPAFKQSLITMGVCEEQIKYTHTMYESAPLHAAKLLPAYVQSRSILFMSRFVREKGIYELLDAFHQIHDEFPDVVLIFAGDGEERENLEARAAALNINRYVHFTGYITGEEKFRLLAHCTIFALPTYFPEGLPIALLEALGAGKPVLTAKMGGIPYIIRTPDNGIVLDHVSAENVATGLRTLLRDPAYCAQVGAHNVQYAEHNFESHLVAGEIETLYYALVQSCSL